MSPLLCYSVLATFHLVTRAWKGPHSRAHVPRIGKIMCIFWAFPHAFHGTCILNSHWLKYSTGLSQSPGRLLGWSTSDWFIGHLYKRHQVKPVEKEMLVLWNKYVKVSGHWLWKQEGKVPSKSYTVQPWKDKWSPKSTSLRKASLSIQTK